MSSKSTGISWTDAEAVVKKHGQNIGGDAMFLIFYDIDSRQFISRPLMFDHDFAADTMAEAIVKAGRLLDGVENNQLPEGKS